MSKEQRQIFEHEGRRAESYAAGWLRFRGYKINSVAKKAMRARRSVMGPSSAL